MVNEKRLVNSFIDYVQIDSETKNELKMCEYLKKELEELGLVVKIDNAGEKCGSNGYNIYALLKGDIDGSIILSAHTDTVAPGNGVKPVIENGIIKSDGTTILGADDKCGIATIIETIRVIKENNLKSKTIEALFTIYEEGGLNGAKLFDDSILQSKHALVLDTSDSVGRITTNAPTQYKMDILIKGRPAHAGLAPQNGINALTVASHAISKMKLGYIDELTSANIGTVHGGLATNIVMPEVKLEAEARGRDLKKLEVQINHMIDTFKQVSLEFGADCEIELLEEYKTFKIEDDDLFLKDITSSFESIGIEPIIQSAGGGSDANILNDRGIKSLVLATGMNKIHTLEEYIKVEDLVNMTKLLLNYLTKENQ